MADCQVMTKRGYICTVEDASFDVVRGVFACHLHNFAGEYQKQIAANRTAALARKAARIAAGIRPKRRCRAPIATAPLKDRF